MIRFVGLQEKTYSYLIDDGSEDKKAKGTKKCVIKIKLKFKHHKDWLEANYLNNVINCLGTNEINIHSLFCHKRSCRESIKNNKFR